MHHKILLVEDEKICQRAASLLLSSLGCRVDLAKNGAETLKLAKSEKYDMIFLDLGLPDMRGDAVANTIKKEPNHINRKTPMVILTAHSNDNERDKCKQANIEEFLTKPLAGPVVSQLFQKYALNQGGLEAAGTKKSNPLPQKHG